MYKDTSSLVRANLPRNVYWIAWIVTVIGALNLNPQFANCASKGIACRVLINVFLLYPVLKSQTASPVHKATSWTKSLKGVNLAKPQQTSAYSAQAPTQNHAPNAKPDTSLKPSVKIY